MLITKQDEPVATGSNPGQRRQPGSAQGLLTIVSDDDEHLEDFKEYMQ